MTRQERFAADYGIDLDAVASIVAAARRCGRLNERACNGDPHRRNGDPTDKNANSELWGADLDDATSVLRHLVRAYGFSDVVYTGLYPTLKRGNRFVEIPY